MKGLWILFDLGNVCCCLLMIFIIQQFFINYIRKRENAENKGFLIKYNGQKGRKNRIKRWKLTDKKTVYCGQKDR